MTPKNSRAKWVGKALFSSGGAQGGQGAAGPVPVGSGWG